MAERGDGVPRRGGDAQFGQQRVVVQRVGGKCCVRVGRIEQRVTVEIAQQLARVGLVAQAVEADGVEPLEDVPVLAVLGGAAMFLAEADDVLEARDDPLLARRAGARLRRDRLDAKRAQQLEVAQLSHSRPPALALPSGAEERRCPRPCAVPTRLAP